MTGAPGHDAEELLRPNEVAAMIRVSVKTLINWDDRGWLRSVPREPGEHRRYRRGDVEAVMNGTATAEAAERPQQEVPGA